MNREVGGRLQVGSQMTEKLLIECFRAVFIKLCAAAHGCAASVKKERIRMEFSLAYDRGIKKSF